MHDIKSACYVGSDVIDPLRPPEPMGLQDGDYRGPLLSLLTTWCKRGIESSIIFIDLHWRTVYTRYGKCYTFNGNKTTSRKSKQGGMGNGLEIMLDIQQDEYLPIWRETNETSLEAGIRVQIHSQDEPPYIHQLGFGVSPGFQTFVSCQEQRLTYLPQPWGNCRSTSKEKIPGYDTYSISACRLLCETNEVMRVCNCRMVHMPGTADICPPSKINCVDKALAQQQKNSGDTCPCETPCNLTRYGKELSMVKIPSKGSARYLSRKYDKSEDYIRDNFLVLDIFFEALNYETIEQKKAYDVAGLLGDIGGQMGLFIGASILTILEILDYMYEAVEMAARWPTPVAIGQCCSCKTSRTNTPTQPDLYLRRQRDLTVLRKADSSSHTLRPPSPGFGPKVTFATTGLSFSLAIANVRSVGCMTSDQPRERSLANAALRNVENVALLYQEQYWDIHSAAVLAANIFDSKSPIRRQTSVQLCYQ
ncbi:hypothetical protein F2P81_021058 [Scophthalmus maximus]|uniref:Acid-sensing ion channel 4 n=1 Tax=Scophthalmus maximus TaxID=52904 RepID=A0A6A4S5A5_SCOMX|nr:hypothetical protein F2P81_021058 [Scophthalmus maximus]